MVRENLIFFREFLQEFEKTGSVCPTSRWAAEELARPIREFPPPRRLLEVGPGTGAVTTHILDAMSDQDQFWVCEINPRFMEALRESLEDEPVYRRHRERVQFFTGAVQDLPATEKFDVIVCGIPFLNLEPETIQEIFDKFRALSTPKSVLTFYQYMGLRHLGRAIPFNETGERLRSVNSFFSQLACIASVKRRRVWLNVPPVNVYRVEHLQD